MSEKAFLVNSIEFQPRWNLTAKQVIKCKVSTRTLNIPTIEMWSFMSIFGIQYGNNSAEERRGVVTLLASHLSQQPEFLSWTSWLITANLPSAQHRSH